MTYLSKCSCVHCAHARFEYFESEELHFPTSMQLLRNIILKAGILIGMDKAKIGPTDFLLMNTDFPNLTVCTKLEIESAKNFLIEEYTVQNPKLVMSTTCGMNPKTHNHYVFREEVKDV